MREACRSGREQSRQGAGKSAQNPRRETSRIQAPGLNSFEGQLKMNLRTHPVQAGDSIQA